MESSLSHAAPLPPETKRLVHDLRNCLAAVRAGANMLRRSPNQPAVVEKVADGLQGQVQEMLEIIDRFVGREPERKGGGAVHPPASKAGNSLRVLIADDNADAARTLATYLRLSGHAVTVALDGGEALQSAAAEQPDVMLLDISMPTLDGYDVARQVRSQSWGSAVRLIAVSGWFSPEDVERSRAAGFDAHLSKPIDMDALPRLLKAAH